MRKVIPYVALLSLVLVGSAYAVTIVVPTNRVFQSFLSGTLTVTNSLAATDLGFRAHVTPLDAFGTSSNDPVMFSGSGFASTSSPSGNWIFEVHLEETANTPPSTTFAVNLLLFESPGFATNSTLYVRTDSTVTPGLVVDCAFDAGSSLGTPLSYIVKVNSI